MTVTASTPANSATPASPAPAPVIKSVHVAVTPRRAFDVFTAGMHRWWPLEHSILKSPRSGVTLEPRVGGRWFESGADGTECTWGRVLAWEPPTRVLLAWQIDGTWAFNPAFETEVEIRFTAEGANGTRVELEHRNIERYGDQAAAMRTALDSAEGWTAGLTRFAAVANVEA